jgi:hypothetical protein
MGWLASLFVGRPLNILAVAAVFLAVHVVLRAAGKSGGHLHRPTFVAAAAWGLYAAWEWLVQSRTPDANIRVDLLVIWPVVAVLSAWAIVRTLR